MASFGIVWFADFHWYDGVFDHSTVSAAIYNYNKYIYKVLKVRRWNAIPTSILPTKPPPNSLQQALRYPDAEGWYEAHDAGLHETDCTDTIQWLSPEFKPPSRLLPPLVWVTGIIGQPVTNSYSARPMRRSAGNSCSHLSTTILTTSPPQWHLQNCPDFFGLKTHLNLCMEHLELMAVLLYDAFGYEKTFYIREMCRSDGPHSHGKKVDILRGNMYGRKISGNSILKGPIALLKACWYSPADFDPGLYYKLIGDNFILFSVCIDDFLVFSTTSALIITLFTYLTAK